MTTSFLNTITPSTNLPLSDAQLVILSKAAQRDDRRIERPAHLRGAANKVIAALIAKSLIEPIPEDQRQRSVIGSSDDQQRLTKYRISTAGLAAIGIEDAATDGLDCDPPAIRCASIAAATQENLATAKSPRAGSKQGQLVAMLSREEGVSIVEIATALGWLPHTTRAALTGLRHKGYELAREISSDRGSLYRITAMPTIATVVADAVQAEAD